MARATSLFVLAHQDDEFGAFAAIEAAIARGMAPVCCYLTDGGYGGQPIEPRNAESTAVLTHLGVHEHDIHFLGGAHGIPDGGLHQHLPSAFEALSSAAGEPPEVREVNLLAWEGGHQDHDAAHAVGLAFAKRYGLLDWTRQFSLYHGAGLVGPLFKVMSLLPENGPPERVSLPAASRARYLRLCLEYRSQWKTWLGLLPFVTARYSLTRSLAVQPVAVERIQAPPHHGAPLYERRGFARVDDVLAEIDRFWRAVS